MTTKAFYVLVAVVLLSAVIYGAATGNWLLVVLGLTAVVLGAIAFRIRAQGGGRPPRRR